MTDKIAVLADIDRRLAAIQTVDEAKAIRDQAEAIRIYAKSARKGLFVQNRAATVKLLAERRAGELLAQVERSKNRKRGDAGILADIAKIGIGTRSAYHWQTLATIPEAEIRKREAEYNDAHKELTSSALYVERSRQQRADRYEAAKRQRPARLTGRYRVVYADPPWQYNDSGVIVGSDAYGRAERHYPTMSVDELAHLPVRDRLTDEAVLFLWVTSPMLSVCWPIIEHWGFDYKASIVWDKVKHNYGHYVSVRHELLLIATRGSCLPDRPTPMPDSVQTIRRSKEHSAKPEEFRELIMRLYDGPYVELFGRRQVDGWTVWGNQVGIAEECA
jgi:N6-adenosine-specific RNA methylase IME4